MYVNKYGEYSMRKEEVSTKDTERMGSSVKMTSGIPQPTKYSISAAETRSFEASIGKNQSGLSPRLQKSGENLSVSPSRAGNRSVASESQTALTTTPS